ncbi:MAG: MscL family protein [Candidatus Goldbacteria bacterium]|nr:MscL family protein [Candidatus Goldiibacteriota bacterium]
MVLLYLQSGVISTIRRSTVAEQNTNTEKEVTIKAKVSLINEFKDFLKEYKVIGLAVGFIMGGAATELVKSLVDNLIMPLVGALIPGGEWEKATIMIWKFNIGWGALLSSTINFLIIAWVVFLVAKFMFKEEKVTKK